MTEHSNFREQGNELFRTGEYEGAIKCYEKALSEEGDITSETEAILYANKSACFLKLEKFPEAICESSKSLQCNPNNVKALFRRCKAFRLLGNVNLAFVDAAELVKLSPEDKAAKETYNELSAELQENVINESSENAEELKLMELSIPTLKERLSKLGLSQNGSKAILVARLEEAGLKLLMTRKRGHNGDSKSDRKRNCVESCRKGFESDCPNSNRLKDNIACHEVERMIRAMGMNPEEAISKCTKAAIMNGHIKVKGEKGELNMILHQARGQCGHIIKAKLGDLLKQPDDGFSYYNGSTDEITVFCTQPDCGEDYGEGTFVSGMCTGKITFENMNGKLHNHCRRCPGFGMCLGDYRWAHCKSCGKHFYRGAMGDGRCSNVQCHRYRPYDEFSDEHWNSTDDEEYDSV